MIRAVLDADVLYPLPLRDTLLWAAAEGCFQAAWNAEILDEMGRNLLADMRITEAGLAKLTRDMGRAFEDAMTLDYERHIPKMTNHPKDRHVAACAVAAGASLIVTSNVKDFREMPKGVSAITPDAFLLRLLNEQPDKLTAALEGQAANLKRNPLTVAEIVGKLSRVAPKFAEAWAAAFPDTQEPAAP